MAKVEGLDRLKARWSRIPQRVKDQVKPAIRQGADELVAMQRRLVEVDDGTLRGSIRTEPGRNETSINVTAGGAATTRPVRNGVDASYDYALANEFGTAEMGAQPFFYPAYRALRKRIRGRITRAVKKAVRG